MKPSVNGPSLLGYVEVRKKDVLRVGGWFWVENNATLWLHLAHHDLSLHQPQDLHHLCLLHALGSLPSG